MTPFLALLAFLQAAHAQVARVNIPEPDGTVLQAALVEAAEPARRPAVVALHGCGGPFPHRDGPWALALAKQGHTVLLPDSFGSRGLGSQCRVERGRLPVVPTRRNDAIAAAEWLAARADTPKGGVVLMGWSNGGATVMWTADASRPPPPGLFRRFVAFYGGCRTELASADWRPAGPLLILAGANDDWVPAAACKPLAARFPGLIRLEVFPDAWHDFDAEDDPVHEMHGLATPPSDTGTAHAGMNPAARAEARRIVPAFVDGD